jgi:hypothetical protein
MATGLVGASLLGLAVFALAGNRGAARSPAGALPVASRADRLGTKLSSIPPHVFTAVGAGSAVAFPLQVAAPALTESGKPAVLYMGAEYCPYCATERWALVVALSRFGSFTGLHVIQSASDDAFPNTQTFTFHGSAYRSPYLAFDAVELETNQRAHGSYTKLDPPTPEQRRLMLTYDGPPFFNPSSTGGIPFIDFGGRYLVSGASFDPSVLQGKSAESIANEIADPSTAVSQGAVGTANALTAAICGLTDDKPSTICSDRAVVGIRPRLK